ncbi:MAG: rhomboid family intramembrane serine protease [Phycisphaerales bacterium]|nr:rhomboid family intramembrane serine protease [Phycisphaerales bacterium]
MFLPLGTDRYSRRPTVVTYALIAANLAVFGLLRVVAQQHAAEAGRWEALATLVPGRSAWWTYLTYAFLHAGFAHIAFNMLALWVFGPDVEDRLGRIGFLGLYLAGAVGAGAHAAFDRHGVVGASAPSPP